MKIRGNILFKEEQQFRVKWLWWIMAISMLTTIGVILGVAVSEKEKSRETWIALAIVIPVESIIAYLMYIAKFQTAVSIDGLYYKWGPFQPSYRFISREEIAEAKVRNGPAMSFGYHWVPGYGTVHNVGPGKGFQLTLKNGKKIFIGTQKQSEFQNAMDRMLSLPNKI